MPNEPTARTRALNDLLRQTGNGGRTFVTRGLDALDPNVVQRIFAAIRTFDSFDEDNDPYGEHDFGALEIEGYHIFFKIDYCELDDSNTASSLSIDHTIGRVMTVMLAEEY